MRSVRRKLKSSAVEEPRGHVSRLPSVVRDVNTKLVHVATQPEEPRKEPKKGSSLYSPHFYGTTLCGPIFTHSRGHYRAYEPDEGDEYKDSMLLIKDTEGAPTCLLCCAKWN